MLRKPSQPTTDSSAPERPLVDRELAHDLFLLMVDLAGVRNQARMIELFLEALNRRLDGLKLSFFPDQEPVDDEGLEVATGQSSFGVITADGDLGALSGSTMALLKSSVRMLGVLLEHQSQADLLSNEKVLLEELVEERTRELTDAYEQLRREVADRQTAQRLSETLLSTSIDGHLLADGDGRLIMVNDAYCEMVGYAREELLTMRIGDLEIDISDEQARAHKAILRLQGQHRFETRHRSKQGDTIHLDVSCNQVKVESGERLFLVFRDITQRKIAEEQLGKTQKLEAVGTLAGGIAHDINNLLGVMVGFTELTQLHLPAEERGHRNLEQVLVAARRAKELVEQILKFSRKNADRRKAVEAHVVAHEAMKLIEASIPTTIELRLTVDPDCGTVRADPTQLHQILMNLCTNACQAMRDEGGLLEIALDAIEVTPDTASLHGDIRVGSYLRITVSDTGPGMSAEVHSRIFEPFYTTKAPGEGTGMGLAVVRGIVNLHQGNIRVESTPGTGTTFFVYLSRDDAPPAEAIEEDPGIGTGTEHVLLVDDEPELARMAGVLLRNLGYRATPMTDSVAALKHFQENPDAFDIVLCDMRMPGLTGVDLAEQMLTIRPDLPVVICTGFSEVAEEERARKLGIRALLHKPFDRKMLATAVRRALVPIVE
jgi:PAS domain S-box-containing protein